MCTDTTVKDRHFKTITHDKERRSFQTKVSVPVVNLGVHRHNFKNEDDHHPNVGVEIYHPLQTDVLVAHHLGVQWKTRRSAILQRLTVSNRTQPHKFIALEKFSHDVILGWDFLHASRAIIDCGRKELVLEDTWDEIAHKELQQSRLCVVEDCDIPPMTIKIIQFDIMLTTGLSTEQRTRLNNILREFKNVFLPKKNRSENVVKHHKNIGDHQPMSQRPYRVSVAERRIIQG
nr:uncharacterized protein LOC122271471 [Parasteatoda tepidariorum]